MSRFVIDRVRVRKIRVFRTDHAVLKDSILRSARSKWLGVPTERSGGQLAMAEHVFIRIPVVTGVETLLFGDELVPPLIVPLAHDDPDDGSHGTAPHRGEPRFQGSLVRDDGLRGFLPIHRRRHYVFDRKGLPALGREIRVPNIGINDLPVFGNTPDGRGGGGGRRARNRCRS